MDNRIKTVNKYQYYMALLVSIFLPIVYVFLYKTNQIPRIAVIAVPLVTIALMLVVVLLGKKYKEGENYKYILNVAYAIIYISMLTFSECDSCYALGIIFIICIK